LLNDDAKGVGEPLNEIAFQTGLVAKGKHILFFGNTQTSPTSVYKQRKLARDNMVLYPWVFFTPTTMSVADWQTNYNVEVI
jgi:lysosomal alpha-mannosidase